MMDASRESAAVLPIAMAILAAALYAISIPTSKLFLDELSPTMTASVLYLGAGVGMMAMVAGRRLIGHPEENGTPDRHDLPFVIMMVVLDIAAPILLMLGLSMTTASSVSLMNNFEIVTTTLIALFVFKEAISRRLWMAILIITASCMILSVDDVSDLSFNGGSLMVLGACICWGLENNCTRRLSSRDPMIITTIKGIFSGLGALIVAFMTGTFSVSDSIPFVLLLGFLSYGLSIMLYIRSQRDLGAARVSAYYAVSPFIGVALSLIFLGETPGRSFVLALALMLVGTALVTQDTIEESE